MNRKLFSVLLFSFSLGVGSANAQNFARKVNTLIGTGLHRKYISWSAGAFRNGAA